MEIIYDSEKKLDYKFKRSRVEEIVQNIENILSRYKGNVVMAREKGITSELIDETFDYVQAYMSAVIMEEIEKEETRFHVEEVVYSSEYHSTGKIVITVKGWIKSE